MPAVKQQRQARLAVGYRAANFENLLEREQVPGTAARMSRTIVGKTRSLVLTSAIRVFNHGAQDMSQKVRRIPQGSMPLLTPFKLGPHELVHRMVMAPMTRDRGLGRLDPFPPRSGSTSGTNPPGLTTLLASSLDARRMAAGQVASPNAAVYYSQRATQGGLIITEGTCISQEGQG